MIFTCPVCDHSLEEDPRQDTFEICPQCGVEFGYNDRASFPRLREKWLARHNKRSVFKAAYARWARLSGKPVEKGK